MAEDGLPVASAPLGLSETAAEAKTPGPLAGWAMVWTMLGIFVGGMALNLTPCVYPLSPSPSLILAVRAARDRGAWWRTDSFTWRAWP